MVQRFALACRSLLRWLRVPCGGDRRARGVGGRAAFLRLAGSMNGRAGRTAWRADAWCVGWFLVTAGLG
jgi:hypothetical protein